MVVAEEWGLVSWDNWCWHHSHLPRRGAPPSANDGMRAGTTATPPWRRCPASRLGRGTGSLRHGVPPLRQP